MGKSAAFFDTPSSLSQSGTSRYNDDYVPRVLQAEWTPDIPFALLRVLVCSSHISFCSMPTAGRDVLSSTPRDKWRASASALVLGEAFSRSSQPERVFDNKTLDCRCGAEPGRHNAGMWPDRQAERLVVFSSCDVPIPELLNTTLRTNQE